MASLAILLLMARLSSSIAISSSSISRSAVQQVIATVAPAVIPDTDGQGAPPFLTSPSGTYAAYLRRVVDGAGGLGGDACYVQIQQVGGEGDSAWESDCTPVGGADACDLAFSPVGLELFAGGHSLWDTGLDADPGTLSLDDGGDMTIVSKEGVTVWKASGEPWTGQQCGAPLPVSTSPSTDALPQPSTASTDALPQPSAASADALPPPSATSTDTLPPRSSTSEKLVTPPADTPAGPGSTDFSFGDQPAPPPVDALPDLPAQPPVDMSPVQPLAPPPAYSSPDSPDLSLPPPPAYTFPDSPDQPLPPPPADMSPDQPLYSSPPPAPAATGPQTPMPPFGMPPLFPPTSAPGETSPGAAFPGATTPPTGEPDSPVGLPFSAPSPVGIPHPHGSPHYLPVGASPPQPDALAPGGGHGAGAGLPFGQGQQPRHGVFGQQPQLLNGEGQPLEESAAGRSPGPGSDHRVVAVCLASASLAVLGFGF